MALTDDDQRQLAAQGISAREAERQLALLAHPPGFARLHPFVSAVSIYPAGYVLAEARVADWRPRLRALGGERWWAAPAAQADIRAHFQQGARITTAPARGWR